MKPAGEAVEILEAFDLTGSLRAASELAGCSPNTVARYVRLRAIGRPSTEPTRRARLIDQHLAKVEEWVERSHGKIRADIVHDKLHTLGFEGSDRTTRRAVAPTGKVVVRIVRLELVVVDDIGLLPAGSDEAEALYWLVDAAYERRSQILTSNLHPARFDTSFPKGLATAAVDRLLHHAHVIVTEGQSHRLSEAMEGRRVAKLQAAETSTTPLGCPRGQGLHRPINLWLR